MENKTNLYKAVLAVMKAVKGIDKNLTVGTGGSAYKGVSDKDVKNTIGKAMEENGLIILPIGIEPTIRVDRWEETVQYGNNPPVTKMKQSIFTEVSTRYLLAHESGESTEIVGYGHGVDPQDKSAGKATTYALKYALLYAFMVPTGKIDDADGQYSDATPVQPAKKTEQAKQSTTAAPAAKPAAAVKQEVTDEQLKAGLALAETVEQFATIKKQYTLTAAQKSIIAAKFNELFPNYKK